MWKICPECGSVEERHTVSRIETYRYKGVQVEVEADVAVCPECGDELFDQELDERTLRAVYRTYDEMQKEQKEEY